MTHYYYPYISVFKALADETRLQIVQMLTCESMCATDLLAYFNITQPSLSYHMRILTGCGLVTARREAGRTMYQVRKDKLALVKTLMETFLEGTALA